MGKSLIVGAGSVNCLGSLMCSLYLQILTFCRFFSPSLMSSSVRRHLHPCNSVEQSDTELQYFPFFSSWIGPMVQKCAKSLQSSGQRCLCKIKMGQSSIQEQLICLHMSLASQSLMSLLVRRQEDCNQVFMIHHFCSLFWRQCSCSLPIVEEAFWVP